MLLEPIITKRLLLRPFAQTDTDAVFRIFGNEELLTYVPMFPLKSREEAEAYLHDELMREREDDSFCLTLCRREDDIPIGYIDLSHGDAHDLGYGLLKEERHRGYMTEGCAAVLETLKKRGFPFVTATHDRENPASGAVMRRLGMTYRYSYHEQWMPKDIPVVFRMYQADLAFADAPTFSGYRKNMEWFVEADAL